MIEGRRDIKGGRLASDRRAAGNLDSGAAFSSLTYSADGTFLLAGRTEEGERGSKGGAQSRSPVLGTGGKLSHWGCTHRCQSTGPIILASLPVRKASPLPPPLPAVPSALTFCPRPLIFCFLQVAPASTCASTMWPSASCCAGSR